MDQRAALIEPLIPGLRRYARAWLRDASLADDLVQDCLERAVASWRGNTGCGATVALCDLAQSAR